MENKHRSVKEWWLSLSAGIIYIVVGCWVFLIPTAAYISFAPLFITSFGILGIIEIYFAIATRKQLQHWEWALMTGLIDLAITLLLVTTPRITLFVLPLYIGFVLMFRSVIGIGFSAYLAHYKVRNWGLVLALSVLGVIFSLLMIWDPVIWGVSLPSYTALSFLSVGFAQVGIAYELHRYRKSFNNLEKPGK